MLGLARHPGVVEVVTCDPDGSSLVLAAPATETLGDLTTRPDLALEVLAAVSETVADLHALGIVHGAVTTDAVLVPADRRPILTAFRAAGLAGESHGAGSPLRPSDDVAALIGLVSTALTTRGEPRLRRGRANRTRASRDGDLRTLVRDATDGRWPPARTLARAIEAELGPRPAPVAPARSTYAVADPFARLRPRDPEPDRARSMRLVTLLAAVAGVASLTWGGLTLRAGSSAPRTSDPVAAAGRHASLPTTTARSTTRAPVTPTVAHGRPVVAHDGVLTVGSTRYSIGRPGDEVVAADWGCRGSVRALVLRPDSGELFVFTGWATAGHDLTAESAGRVTPGSHLATATDGRGCPVADAVAPAGRTARVDPGQA
jgi:hypothetical protein